MPLHHWKCPDIYHGFQFAWDIYNLRPFLLGILQQIEESLLVHQQQSAAKTVRFSDMAHLDGIKKNGDGL